MRWINIVNGLTTRYITHRNRLRPLSLSSLSGIAVFLHVLCNFCYDFILNFTNPCLTATFSEAIVGAQKSLQLHVARHLFIFHFLCEFLIPPTKQQQQQSAKTFRKTERRKNIKDGVNCEMNLIAQLSFLVTVLSHDHHHMDRLLCHHLCSGDDTEAHQLIAA